MRVLVCGSRFWCDRDLIRHTLAELAPEEVLHGEGHGADRLAGAAARELGIPVRVFPAEWEKYGRAAGPVRNERMLREGQPDLVVAFHDDPELGRGTADMVRRAQVARIPVRVVRHRVGVLDTHGTCSAE